MILAFLVIQFIGGIGEIMADNTNQIHLLFDSLDHFDNNDDVLNNFIKVFPDGDILLIKPIYGCSICCKYEKIIVYKNEVGEYLGKIKRAGIQNSWEIWDATKLKVGTKIYKYKQESSIIIAVQDNQYIPYLVIMNFEL